MHTNHILFVVTSADRMGSAPEPTGSWLEEIAAPYYTFLDAHCNVTLASPKGGVAPLDPKSFEDLHKTASTERFHADAQVQEALGVTTALADIQPEQYDGIFFAGGHGTMTDFPVDADVKRVIEAFYAAGKPVSSVCHGPACLVNACKPSGEPMVRGHKFTCFSNEEEGLIGLEKIVPFLLESRLVEQGGTAACEPAFTPCVVVDANLITGQNPVSAIGVAEAVIHHLRSAHATEQYAA